MIEVLTGAVVAGTILLAAVPVRPVPGRRSLASPYRSAASPAVIQHLGAWFRRRSGLGGSPLPDALLGAAAALTPVVLLLAPIPGVALAVAVWLHAQVARRRTAASQQRLLARVLPDCVDLFLLCAGAGLALPLAHPLVAARAPVPLGPALRASDSAAALGRPRAEALTDALTPLGERSAGLAHVLVDHLRYGVPLAPALERLSLELRLDRRRRAEEAARRVPVRLLAPLVTCILPAFGLLTVVPLLAASLQALPR